MKEETIGSIPYPTPEGAFTLRYDLLSDSRSGAYGIRVVKCGAAGRPCDRADVFPISGSRPRALALLQRVMRGSVPPCTLREVLEDLTAWDPAEPGSSGANGSPVP